MSNWLKAQTQQFWILVFIILLLGGGGFFFYMNKQAGEGGFSLKLPDWIINIVVEVPESEGGGEDGSLPPSPPPPTPPPSDVTKPTSLSCSLIYYELDMGQYELGSVSSNGRNYPITIIARHRGSGEFIEIAGFLNDHGMWTSPAQLMDTPGYWEFWVEADEVKSNTVYLTVHGIRVSGESEHYSKTFKDSFLIKVYTDHKSVNVAIIGNYPSGAYSQPITNCVVNTYGYGEVSPNLDSLANGDWEIDAIIGSDQASLWDGTCWVDVGR